MTKESIRRVLGYQFTRVRSTPCVHVHMVDNFMVLRDMVDHLLTGGLRRSRVRTRKDDGGGGPGELWRRGYRVIEVLDFRVT